MRSEHLIKHAAMSRNDSDGCTRSVCASEFIFLSVFFTLTHLSLYKVWGFLADKMYIFRCDLLQSCMYILLKSFLQCFIHYIVECYIFICHVIACESDMAIHLILFVIFKT